MLVNTGRLWPGRRVLVSPAWIAWVSWLQRNVRVDLSGETIRNAPAYDVSRPFTAHDEARLLTYYESREPGGSHERDALASRAGRPPRH
jgi:hypothetical protein